MGMDIMYVGGMSEDHLGALANLNQLKGYAIVYVFVIVLIMYGTWKDNSDLWDKFGDEMRKLNKTLWRNAWRSIGWIPAMLRAAEAKHHHVQEYVGRHRLDPYPA